MKAQAFVLGGQGQLGRCLFTWRAVCPILFLTLGVLLKVASGTGDRCGHPLTSQRVVGGKNSVLSKYPWTISLQYKNRHICGASIISRRWVVTAAHCVFVKDHKQFSVKMGASNLRDQNATSVLIKVKTVLVHPIFNGDGSSGDLAALELETPINFTKNFLPICLPRAGQGFPDEMKCIVTGWGYIADKVKLPDPAILQEVDLPLVNAPACDERFKAKYPETYSGGINSDMICAGSKNESKDACQGDSGGPLACKHGDTWMLVGIVSWGVGCATPGVPGVYTKVSNFTTWINEKRGLNDTTISETMSDSTTVQAETLATPKTKLAETRTTLKPKQAAQSATLSQQSTTNGANLRSSTPLSLLIMCSVITKVWDSL